MLVLGRSCGTAGGFCEHPTSFPAKDPSALWAAGSRCLVNWSNTQSTTHRAFLLHLRIASVSQDGIAQQTRHDSFAVTNADPQLLESALSSGREEHWDC